MTYHDREFRFLAPGRLVGNLTPKQLEAGNMPIGASTLLILTGEQTALIQRLQRQFPGGTVETHIGNTPTESSRGGERSKPTKRVGVNSVKIVPGTAA